MADLQGFDANQVEPNFDFPVLPNGQYLAVITSSEMKRSQKGGSYLELKWQVIDGEHKGATVFSRLNLEHEKPSVVKMAQAELSAICRAVGVYTPKDSHDLHDLPAWLTVACIKRKDGSDKFNNEIKAYKSRADHQAQSQSRPATQATDRPWS